MTGGPPVTALVLAGSRRGENDPVARYRQAASKCLVTVGGVPMLVRVVQALADSSRIGRILVSVDREAMLDELPELAQLRASRRLQTLSSSSSLSDSVATAFALAGAPMLVTTADHALLDPAMIEHFLAAADFTTADVAVGLTSAAVIASAYPKTKRTYIRFRDGGYSGANLFLLRTSAAKQGIEFWRRIERDRKAPWRLARAFGPVLLGAYLLRAANLNQAMRLVSRRLGMSAAAIAMPMAEASIDVDKPVDLDLVESIVESRARAGGAA